MNKFGWCSSIKDAELIGRLGYDFIEVALSSLKLEEHAKLLAPVLASPIPVKAFNVFFPGDLKIVGPAVDTARVRNYIEKAAEVLSKAGASIIVLGSGGARNVPEGWDRTQAEEQFTQVLNWCADSLKGSGVTLAIEPLNRKESNIVNSVEEGVKFAKLVNRPEIRVLADFYHMDEEKEPLTEIAAYGEWLAHIHLADTGRRNPGSGQYDYPAFVKQLEQIGYTGMISVECKVEDKEREMAESLAFIRSQWG
jgi:sugar phosphate isomerase/epimerase